MLSTYFLDKPINWIFPWILQSIAYFFILRKMGLRKKMAIIPFLAEREFSTVLFRKMRTFWRPFIITAVFVIGAYYLGPYEGSGHAYMYVAFVVYGLFLLRLYYRMSKSFGHGVPYTILMILFPTLFLLILGFGKSKYTPLEFKSERHYGKFLNGLRKSIFVLVSAIELVVLVAGVGFFTLKQQMPAPIVNNILSSTHEKTKDIVSDDKALSREDTMGEAAASVATMETSRKKFFPDHSSDESVVVMEYIIGSNLERAMGMGSANITMMKDATERGDALTFVLQAGGSKRWFTDGIDDGSLGRYTVKNGKVEAAEIMPEVTTMEDPEMLTGFIKWTADNYPADRYILVLWDHGGGVCYGYGEDGLSHRKDTDNFNGIRVSEIADAVKASGVKFDMIGFDACLMQDIEIAVALEPYADYYLASEETEGGMGWYYTDAFGRLAADPGMSSEDFGRAIISTYDQFNDLADDSLSMEDGKATLSFIDLTLAKPAYEKTADLFKKADAAIKRDSADFADLGLAATNTYAFDGNMQIDLIDLIEKLNDTDVNDSISTAEEKTDVINALKASVVYRNSSSADGINGLSVALPYEAMQYYDMTSAELERLGLADERKLFNDVFSIIAAQKAKKSKEAGSEGFDISSILSVNQDYTKEDWYVKGFENYDPVTTLVDIPLEDTGSGYRIDLPDKTWDIIADCQTIMYQKTDDGRLRYLGKDHLGEEDESGHPMIDMDDRWVHINGRLVCYEETAVRETKDGTIIYEGDVKARLNGGDDIIVHVKFSSNDEGENTEGLLTGSVTGYDYADNEGYFMEKGSEKFKSGDRIRFLFDYYDEEGNLVATEPNGRNVRVSKQSNLKVTDEALPAGEIEFLGILTDVYQRDILTETINAEIG